MAIYLDIKGMPKTAHKLAALYDLKITDTFYHRDTKSTSCRVMEGGISGLLRWVNNDDTSLLEFKLTTK